MNLAGLVNVRLDELTVVGRQCILFSCVKGDREDQREVSQNLPWRQGKIHCTHCDACRRETGMSPETPEVRAGRQSGSFTLRAHRTVQTRPVSSRSVRHRICPEVYFQVIRAAARPALNGVKDRASVKCF